MGRFFSKVLHRSRHSSVRIFFSQNRIDNTSQNSIKLLLFCRCFCCEFEEITNKGTSIKYFFHVHYGWKKWMPSLLIESRSIFGRRSPPCCGDCKVPRQTNGTNFLLEERTFSKLVTTVLNLFQAYTRVNSLSSTSLPKTSSIFTAVSFVSPVFNFVRLLTVGCRTERTNLSASHSKLCTRPAAIRVAHANCMATARTIWSDCQLSCTGFE